MLVPGDDPPFATVHLEGAPEPFPLRRRQGRELVGRLEARGDQRELVARILAARSRSHPQRFDARPEDEAALLAALETPPELRPGRLADLRDALRARAG